MTGSDDLTDLFDLDIDELFKRVIGKPIIDVNLSLEETMERFLEDLSRRKGADGVQQ